MKIKRKDKLIYHDEISVSQIKRSFTELVEYLFRSQVFHKGAVLLTGTGIVPDNDFTLQPRDKITINITGIGTLENHVVQV
jgi:2-dehydro-3-deoxy-D-arabinonate dehydratase